MWCRYYAYDPSFAAPIAVSVVFGIMFVAHVFLMFRRKAWYVSRRRPTTHLGRAFRTSGGEH